MTPPSLRRVAVTTVALVTLVAACHKAPPPPPPAPSPTPEEIAARARADSIAKAEAMQRAYDDSVAGARAAAEAKVREAAAALARWRDAIRDTVGQRVLFAYDKSALTDADLATLQVKLAVLQANASLHIQVAGNTDERGSAEYNLALGQRRAAAAQRWLVNHGIDAGRIEIISYGEERPAATGSDEAAWSQNRRDEFVITGGLDTLMPVADR